MKICPFCAAHCPDDDLICRSCGKLLPDADGISSENCRYGGPEPGGYRPSGQVPIYRRAGTSGFATASLVLGIVGLLSACCFGLGGIPAILAVIFSLFALHETSDGFLQGRGMAVAGLVTGIIGFLAAAVLLFFLFILPVFSLAGYSGSGGYENQGHTFQTSYCPVASGTGVLPVKIKGDLL